MKLGGSLFFCDLLRIVKKNALKSVVCRGGGAGYWWVVQRNVANL